MPVTTIRDASHFQTCLTEAGSRLVIVDFTAKWCGPCRFVAPDYERLSNQYTQVLFLKVDVDDCDAVAQANNITAMPTFIFFKAKTPVARLQGASARKIEEQLIQLLGQTPSGAGESSVQSYGSHIELSPFITKSGCECLNESDDHPLQHCLESNENYLESDCDEQLIITLAFSQPIKLHSIKMRAPKECGPRTLRLFLNQPRSLDFDKAEQTDSVQDIELKPEDLSPDAEPVQLRYVKFQNVNSLTIFVKDNQSGQETTRINQILLFGSPVAATNMKDLKRMSGKQGEVH